MNHILIMNHLITILMNYSDHVDQIIYSMNQLNLTNHEYKIKIYINHTNHTTHIIIYKSIITHIIQSIRIQAMQMGHEIWMSHANHSNHTAPRKSNQDSSYSYAVWAYLHVDVSLFTCLLIHVFMVPLSTKVYLHYSGIQSDYNTTQYPGGELFILLKYL